jgi:hypothetical protein
MGEDSQYRRFPIDGRMRTFLLMHPDLNALSLPIELASYGARGRLEGNTEGTNDDSALRARKSYQ